MRRLFTLLLVLGGLAAVGSPAAAQVLAPLPSGVTLRINGPQAHLLGVLYSQSVDSVSVRKRGDNQPVQTIAAANITRVEQAQPAYAKSVLVGTGLGVLLGAALYPITSHDDHDLFIGLSVIGGAVAGLMFPHTDWVPVRLH